MLENAQLPLESDPGNQPMLKRQKSRDSNDVPPKKPRLEEGDASEEEGDAGDNEEMPFKPINDWNVLSRQLTVTNVPKTASAKDVLDVIRHGSLEFVVTKPLYGDVVISFLNHVSANAVVEESERTGLWVHGIRLGIRKRLSPRISPFLDKVLKDPFASRCVRMNMTRNTRWPTMALVHTIFDEFGEVDNILAIKDEGYEIHMMSIASAVTAIDSLQQSTDPFCTAKFVFGRDRCAAILPSNPNALITIPNTWSRRTVIMYGISRNSSLLDIFELIQGGAVEKLVHMEGRVKIRFVHEMGARRFVQIMASLTSAIHYPSWSVELGMTPSPPGKYVDNGITITPSRCLRIYDLPETECSLDELLTHFEQYGTISSVARANAPDDVLVSYTSIKMAIKALKNSGGVGGKWGDVKIKYSYDPCAFSRRFSRFRPAAYL